MAEDMNFEKQNEGPKPLVEITKFKGRPVLVLRKTEDDKYPFSFGLGKARQIIDNYEVIENFVNDHSKDAE